MGNVNPQGHVEVSNWLKHYFYLPPKTGNIADCSDPLGLSTNQISDDSVFATSWQPGRSGPWYGRLNNESRRSWCSTVSDDNQYIQVNNNIAFCQILLQFCLDWNFVWSVWIRENSASSSKQLSTLPTLGELSQIIRKSPGCRRNLPVLHTPVTKSPGHYKWKCIKYIFQTSFGCFWFWHFGETILYIWCNFTV